ncbi:ABC transporter permease subunit [Micromonospora olivasterospora]|uniref:ABC-2 family transporter n=1 Tax=Micromonospora olivasterospora TaxID=1880 RepID=A0A562IDB8_MICOL|nr:ABC transporter permease subunit [Micromonospora olivasterospora]TWH68725.1 ABC-2 family transporter [Micromonospora olivasterospora]
MNLVRAELERLAARRFVQLMLVLLVLAFAVTAMTTLVSSHRPSADEVVAAGQAAAEQRQDLENEYRRCVAAVQGDLPLEEAEEYPDDCSGFDPARRDRLPVAADHLSGVFMFADQARLLLYFLVAFLVLFGFLVGASYIGADIATGGVVNLLIWRPRRLAVLGAKLGTLLGALALLTVLATAAYLGTFWLIGQTAGLPGATGGDFWPSLGVVWLRGLVLVLLAATIGFAIATLGRRTAAALGAVTAYAVVWELGLRVVMEVINAPRSADWMLSTYLDAWLTGEARLADASLCLGVEGYCDGNYQLGWGVGLTVLLALAGVLTVAAFAAFRRRDLV